MRETLAGGKAPQKSRFFGDPATARLDRWREGKEYPNSIRQAPQNATSVSGNPLDNGHRKDIILSVKSL